MPISPALIFNAEIVMEGIIASGGSDQKTINNVFTLKRTTNVNVPDKAVMEAGFNTGATAVVTTLLLALNARYTQTRNRVRWLDDAEDAYLDISRAGVGAIAGDSLPTSQAVYQLFRTGFRGRSFRGSKHYAPISESDIGDDVLVAGAVTRFDAVGTRILAGFTDANGNVWKFTVLSRTLSTLTTNPTVVVNNEITAALTNQRVGGMDSRKVKSVY